MVLDRPQLGKASGFSFCFMFFGLQEEFRLVGG